MVFFDENQAASEAASAFEASLRLWGTLSPCRTAERHGVLLLSTGTAIPDQNYALKTGEGPIPLMAGEALTFFASENMPFTWWVPPGTGALSESGELARAGLPLQCSPPAMILPLREGRNTMPPFPEGENSVCRTPGEAIGWAASSLGGFGSEPEHLEPFAAFASSMATGKDRERFRLLVLSFRGRPAATALLTLPGKTAGLFYFSVLPEFRRLGLGKRLLDNTLEEALEAGCSSVALQASPMGFSLYRKYGFRECGRFLVHSPHTGAC